MWIKTLLLILFPLTAFSQSGHSILRDFSARQEGEAIILDWTIKGGNTCQGISIERFSNEQQLFQPIGQYDGICGSTENDERYEFVDSFPLPNQTNLYRLELGHQGYTNVLSVEFFTFNADDYILLGNPLVERTRIVFDNPLGDECQFSLYDLGGKLISNSETSGGEIVLLKDGLRTGIYLFNITSKNGIDIVGKLNVL